MPRNTATNPSKQSGTQGSRGKGSRRPMEVYNSGEVFEFAIDEDDEGSEDIEILSQTPMTSAPTKNTKAHDIKMFFRVNPKIGKRVCTPCG
jgi:hypothetical protein